jgi:NADH-quinone oxidoreductase subunit N
MTWLAVLGVIASVIGAFYYLRIVFYMYFGAEPVAALDRRMAPVPWLMLMASAFVMLAGVINLFGIEGAAQAAAGVLVR